MDNQLIPSSLGIKQLLIIVFAVATAIAIALLGIYWHQNSDPYIKEVLAIEGDLANGRDIFQINCSGCHAFNASRSVGPNLINVSKRKSKREIIKQVISGSTPPMPKFKPSFQEMADLLNYLEQF